MPARLLGAHVGRCTENNAFGGAAGRYRRRLRRLGACAVASRRFGEPEIEHLHGAVGRDLDVGRLQIPVDDPSLMRRVERISNLFRDPK